MSDLAQAPATTPASAPRDAPPLRRPRGPVPAAVGALLRPLRRMSTALYLLLAVAAGAVLAVAIPQEATNPTAVAHWRAGVSGPGPMVTALLDGAGLFDIMGTWWFQAIAGLLLVSLVACLVPRHRALARAWRRLPPRGRSLDELTHRVALRTALPPDEALAAARTALRRRRHRCRVLPAGRDRAAQLAAERGVRAREAGSLAFHDAVLLLLLGVAVGHVFGFTGQVDVVEGAAFSDTRLSYDGVTAGPGFGVADHRGFVVGLDAFRTSDLPDGTPREFVATVRVDGGPPVEVEVNHPLIHDGVRLHLARHGLAPTVRIADGDGTALFDAPVLLAPAGPLAWVGLAVVRDDRGERAVDLVWLPDARVDADGRPTAVGGGSGGGVLVADVYPGMAVRTDGRARSVDRSVGALGTTAVVTPEGSAPLGDAGWTIAVGQPVRWAGFSVSRTPGLRLLLVAGLILLAGLVVSLYATPQRLWVEARAVPGGSELVVAGVGRHRPWALDRTFPAAVRAIERRLARSR
jgi:cytochrome c biogenesis protein